MGRDDINKVADWMMANGYATGHGETMEDLLAELKWQIDEKVQLAVYKLSSELLADFVALHDKYSLATRSYL